MIAVTLWSVGLFAAGGTDLNGKGHKWFRRFVMPLGLAGVSLMYAQWWQSLLYSVTLIAFLHMGYGSKASWWYRVFIFAGYGASCLWLGWTWWSVIIPPVLLVMFILSNIKLTAQTFYWKACEMSMGFLLAISFCDAIMK